MAMGPGPGSHQVGGAHVRLTMDDRSYYQKLNQAAAALNQFARSVSSIGTVSFRPMQQGLVNATNRWWIMNQAVQRTVQSINQATAAAVRFSASSGGQSFGSLAQVIRAQAYAQAQMALAAYRTAQAQAASALAGQRTARTRTPAQPAGVDGGFGSIPAGDALAFKGMLFLDRIATSVLNFSKRVNAFGARASRGFDSLSNMFGRIASGPGLMQGIADRAGSVVGLFSRFGANLEHGFYALNRQLLSFDFRGGISGKIATGLQSMARSVADLGDRAISGLQRRGIFRFSPALLGAFDSISGKLWNLSLDFWGISKRFNGPWQAMSRASASIGRATGVLTRTMVDFGDRMIAGFTAITQYLPSPWKMLSSAAGRMKNVIFSMTVGITTALNSAYSVIHGFAGMFGSLGPVFNVLGAAFGRMGTFARSAFSRISSIALPVVTRSLGVFSSLVMGGIGLLGTGLKAIGGQIARVLGGIFKNVGQIGAITIGVAGGFSLLYIHRQIVDMEHELTRLRRTTGATAQEVQRLALSFNDMSTTLAGVELNKILDLAIMGSRLGVPADQLNLFTRDLARVSAVLEDIPIDEAAQRFSGLIDVFQLAYPDTIRLASALNALDIASNASGRDILDISGRMSGAASTIGLTVQQTLALATAMRQARVPIETAGTAMSQILGRMTGQDLPAFARVAGLSGRAFTQLLQKDAIQALIAVEQGLGRLTPLEKFRALDKLHLDGQRVRLVMLQLVPVLGRLQQYLGLANEEWQTTNSIMSGFRLQAETASAMLKRMWNNIQLLAVSLGTFLLPIVKGVTNAIGNLSADVANFVNQRGERLRAWGERVAEIFESLGAFARVNWGDIGAILRSSVDEIWAQIQDRFGRLRGQLGANLAWFWRNFLTLAGNAFNNLRAMAVSALAAILPVIQSMITNAILTAARAIAAAMGAALRGMLGINMKALANVPQAIIQPPVMRPWLQGAQAPPGFGIPGIKMPDQLAMIAGIFGLGAQQQKQQRIQREAAGNLGDMLVRLLARVRGKGGQDQGLGRMIGLANMEDQAAGVGGMGGAGGAGGVGMDAGMQALAGMAAGQGGAGGGMAGGMAGGPPAARNPVAGNRLRAFLHAAGLGGFAGQTPAERHADLIGWRARMAARRPGMMNPWAEFRNTLAAQRQAQFMALGGGGVIAARQRRMGAIRRLEAMRRGRMEGRLGVREEVANRFRAFQNQQGMFPNGFGAGMRFNPFAQMGQPPVDPLQMIRPVIIPNQQQRPPLAGLKEWGNSAVGQIADRLDRIERAIGPVFGG